jgi:phage-related minor tail protein
MCLFAQMYADATKGSDTAKAAMTTAATTAEEIAKSWRPCARAPKKRSVGALRRFTPQWKSSNPVWARSNRAVTKAQQVIVTDATAKMAEAYKGLTAMVQANLQKQVDAVKTRYQQEQTALDLSSASQATQIAKSTLLLTDA